MPAVFLALGTNIGAREENLRAALQALQPQVSVTCASAVYETEPLYVTEQPKFLNMVVQAQTDLSPIALLTFLKTIEKDMGRTPSRRFGPRLIDLDILAYGGEIISSPELTVPHPRIAERAFVLRPLADIEAEWMHPQTGQSVAMMLTALREGGEVVMKYERLD